MSAPSQALNRPVYQLSVPVPLSRDQFILLFAAFNELALGLETYLAHSISGTIRPYEWIPIVFGLVAGALLLLAGAVALRRHRAVAVGLATLVLASSVVVGLLGTYFHLVRGMLPSAAPGHRVVLGLFEWSPPVLAPLMFVLVGVLGLSAAWVETEPDSGVLVLRGRRRLTMPFSKTRAYLLLVTAGCLITVTSSVLDHARTNFANPWTWVPIAVGVFATVVAATTAFFARPSRTDWQTFAMAMTLMALTGAVGAFLHLRADLAVAGAIVLERFVRGAPLLAPFLFSNMGILGLLVLLRPDTGTE